MADVTHRIKLRSLLSDERIKTEEFLDRYHQIKHEAQSKMYAELEEKGINYELDNHGNAVVRWSSYTDKLPLTDEDK